MVVTVKTPPLSWGISRAGRGIFHSNALPCDVATFATAAKPPLTEPTMLPKKWNNRWGCVVALRPVYGGWNTDITWGRLFWQAQRQFIQLAMGAADGWLGMQHCRQPASLTSSVQYDVGSGGLHAGPLLAVSSFVSWNYPTSVSRWSLHILGCTVKCQSPNAPSNECPTEEAQRATGYRRVFRRIRTPETTGNPYARSRCPCVASTPESRQARGSRKASHVRRKLTRGQPSQSRVSSDWTYCHPRPCKAPFGSYYSGFETALNPGLIAILGPSSHRHRIFRLSFRPRISSIPSRCNYYRPSSRRILAVSIRFASTYFVITVRLYSVLMYGYPQQRIPRTVTPNVPSSMSLSQLRASFISQFNRSWEDSLFPDLPDVQMIAHCLSSG
ncbi:hypothetical protein ACRALDRAFT_205923 [Sodiomyces alcalophilus JCM 7366]|uniref:uncharacterized protein n=1 Tax=Sodiomyces alcalophilus JCM 7366 TaxID=591952 RepID=UPI0039B5B12A